MTNQRCIFLAVFLLAGICMTAAASATTTCSNSSYPAAQLTGLVAGTAIQLNWNAITDPGFQGYKVVISKNSASPRYPDDGYLYFITDPNRTSATVDSSSPYTGGDIGGQLQPGVTYYFSITTLYCDRAVPGNVITLTFPGIAEPVPTTAAVPSVTATATPVTTAPAPAVTTVTTTVPPVTPAQEYRAPVVRGTVDGNHIRLNWNAITDSRLLGYRVVVSRNSPAPIYPADGYMYWITDLNQNFATIDDNTPYYGGDMGWYLQPGIIYNFSVTAVYTEKNVAGNSVRMNFPSGITPVPTRPAGYAVPTVTGNAEGNHVKLSWEAIHDTRLQGYKVVISRNNPNPGSPDDGYLFYITDPGQNSATIDLSRIYNGGDFGGHIRPGEAYYFSVTAIYKDRAVPGRASRLTFPKSVTPVPTQQVEYPVPQVTGTVEGSAIRLNWNVINDNRFQGYKVVISRSNADPKYPDDGYLVYITDRNRHSARVDSTMTYTGGDFGGRLVPGETYHFSITALYTDRKVAGNAITLVCPKIPTTAPTATPVATATPVPTATPVTTVTTSVTTAPVTTVTTPVPEVTTATPTPEVTAEPTRSIYDLIEEQNRKIDAQSMLIAEQNKKLTVQSGILDRLLGFLKSVFRF
jgi:hypothetical protein